MIKDFSQPYIFFFHHFVLAKLVTSSIGVNIFTFYVVEKRNIGRDFPTIR